MKVKSNYEENIMHKSLQTVMKPSLDRDEKLCNIDFCVNLGH